MSPGTPPRNARRAGAQPGQAPQVRAACDLEEWAPAQARAPKTDCQGGDCSVWHMKRYTDGQADCFEEFLLTLTFAEKPGAAAAGVHVAGYLAPCVGPSDAVVKSGACVRLDGQLTKVSLRLEHQDPRGGELFVYRSERFVTEGDGQFRGVWMCGARTGRFSAARRSSPEDTRKQRKSACRRKADAEIRSKRFFNDLKDDLLILDRLGWSEQRWKGESKLEKGRAILLELRRELGRVFEERGIHFHQHTPWLQRVEAAIGAAREAGDVELLRQLRAVDCSLTAQPEDRRSDWHTLLEIQRGFCALPPFRATRYLEPSNVRHALRCAEVLNRAAFEPGGLYLGGARQLLGAARPGAGRGELWERAMRELRPQCLAGDLGVDEAYDVRVQLVIRAGSSEFLWEPGPDLKLHAGDRVYYEQAHVWCEDRRARRYRHGQDAGEMQRRLAEFEHFLTAGREDLVYEEDFEFVEMTARAESGAAEGVPTFLEHSVTGDVRDASELFERVGEERGWANRPKALNLGQLFKTRLAGYRRLRSREIVWGPGPGLYWERGDRPLRLLRMSQEPVRVFFSRREEPYGFHLQDVRGGAGAEVIEVVEGSPADARGVVVGRTVKRLCSRGQSWDVRHWGRAQLEEALAAMPEGFVVEFGKGDTEERRHAPLGDAEMAILMDERFMRGFLHELWHGHEAAERHFDHEGWAQIFPGLEAAAEPRAPEGPPARPSRGAPGPEAPRPRQLAPGEDPADGARRGPPSLRATPRRRGSPAGEGADGAPPHGSAAPSAALGSGAECEAAGPPAGAAREPDCGRSAGLGMPRRAGGAEFSPADSWQILRPDYPLKVPINAQRVAWPGADALAASAPPAGGLTAAMEPVWRATPQPPLPAYARAPPGLPPPPAAP